MEKEQPSSMVAPKSKAQEQLTPLETLAAAAGLTAARLAGIRRANGWAEGKQVTPEEFNEAVIAFNKRPMGGGR